MDPRHDSVGVTLATWLLLLHRGGQALLDPAVSAACAAVAAGGESGTLAAALVAAVRARVAGDDFAAVSWGLGGIVAVAPQPEEGSADAFGTLRSATFGDSRPLLALMADRVGGVLVERWVLVASVGAVVALLDPNPWDDVDEDRVLSAEAFAVRWELAGGRAIRAG